ncbi:hypothetical protein NEOLEDRAFT_66838 [Neolentinus lepideus HHB14362 ss-1]|uniref:HAUS augmin-like complex subunit 4 n=1 Tax=Neolentinus lepideus HHB14362 ss-1 TaxID=1314782 RepID=A0A165UAH5_9AGAM|nr:hypothetical protein NEOLEDRAFT_66838 [Neolentinus lepideus HHB14362 ss-1]
MKTPNDGENTCGSEQYPLKSLPGGLNEDDIRRYAASTMHLDDATQEQLANTLQRTLTEVATFYWGDEELSQEQLEERLQLLPDELNSHLDHLHRDEEELSSRQGRIQNLVGELHKIHPRLRSKLSTLLSNYSIPMRDKHFATQDLVSSKIETSLLKLSVLRAKAYADLYGYHSSKNPEATMTKALSAAHERYTAEERRLQEEERKLDRQLKEYQQLLELVDGKSRDGGFAQVVEDWVRVQKETEECKRDLRRLGWTGD